MSRKIVYVGFAFMHHKGTHAGYHQIQSYLDYDYVIDCQSYFEKSQKEVLRYSLVERIKRRLLMKCFGVSNVPWYLLKIICLGWLHDNLTFHYIYGENIFFPWVKKLMRKGNIVVCTLHQPFSFFETTRKRQNIVLSSDYIILVGNSEVKDFKKMTGKDNVVYIPHGITSDFYCIDQTVRKEKVVLTVGSWLRDFKFANKVYQRLLDVDSNIQIHIVSNPKNKELIDPSERIKFMSGITDEQLKEEYLKSSVLFLPLTRYTANNSLLESSAIGCNIVIASDYPDNSYIPEKYITIVKMEVESAVNAILGNMDLGYNETLSKYIDKSYSWKVIAEKTETYLRSL